MSSPLTPNIESVICPVCSTHNVRNPEAEVGGPVTRTCGHCRSDFEYDPQGRLTTKVVKRNTKLETAPCFLHRAADIMDERGKQYDKPEGERSMGKCVAAFNIVTGQNLTEAEGWLLLQILKDVRQWQRPGFHQDSADDCIAYAALKAEAKQKEAA